MANKSYGIFYNGDTALGVEVVGTGPQLHCNFIELGSDTDMTGPDQLREVARRMAGSKPLVLTLGGTMYMSHDHRSEFEDIAQAAQTLKYDIEDSLAVDAENIAVCYQEKPTLTSTVDMIVYTAPRSELAGIFAMMEEVGSDPLAALPVTAAWQNYLINAGCTGSSAIYLGRGEKHLQLMVLNDHGQPVTCRKFPVSGDQSLYATLKLELNRCCLTALTGMTIQKLYCHSDGISPALISDIASDLGLELKTLPQESFARASAIGAALSSHKGAYACNFRTDGMEPVSIVKNRNKAKFVMSAMVCSILLTWILWNVACIYRCNSIITETTKNIVAAAEACQVNTEVSSRIATDIDRKLKRFKQLLNGSGTFDTESATNTFNLMLSSLGRLNTEFDMNILAMTFKPGEVKPFSGTVPDLEALKTLRKVLSDEKSGLLIVQETARNTGERQSFEMPLIPAPMNQPVRR